MIDRTDALAAASEFVLDVERAAHEVVALDSETAVATVGELSLAPNARNVVPGHISLSMDVRDVDYEAINELIHRSESSLARLDSERSVETSLARYRDQEPIHMSDRCVAAVRDAAVTSDLNHLDMHSAAMHDTANIASLTDAVLIFVPSEDGLSHNPHEFTSWDDCAAGARVLAGAITQLTT
jgi:Acetylornithine deacetylase/Succinyl-diaminopimelate desuccinylase and related deacylases